MELLDHNRYVCWRRRWHPTPILLPGKSHGWRSLVGCSSYGREESDMTEQLPFHFSLSCIGEGNGNPLQCSCLENLRDEGAWWAAIYGVTESDTTKVTQQQQEVGMYLFSSFPKWLYQIASLPTPPTPCFNPCQNLPAHQCKPCSFSSLPFLHLCSFNDAFQNCLSDRFLALKSGLKNYLLSD